MTAFKQYTQTVHHLSRQFKEAGHAAIHPAFDGQNKSFTTNNWNDPLIGLIRHQATDALRADPTIEPFPDIQGHLIDEDDQHTLILEGVSRALVFSWYKNRGRTEHLYFLSRPTLPVTFESLLEWCDENNIDIINDLKKM